MSSEEIPSEINTHEGIEANEVSPSSDIERSESEVANEAIEQINAEIAAVPGASIEIGKIESTLSLEDSSQSTVIKKEMEIEAKLEDLNIELNNAKAEALTEIASVLEVKTPNLIDQKTFDHESDSKPEGGGITDIFDSHPQLSEIGTKEQYDAYLKTLFPENFSSQATEDDFQHLFNRVINDPSASKVEKNFIENFITEATMEEFDKTKPYVRSEHSTINGLLREGKEVTIENVLAFKNKEVNELNKEWDMDVVDSYSALNEMMEKSHLHVDGSAPTKQVYRVVSGNSLFSEKNIGDTIEEKAFISSSIDAEYKDFYLNDEKEETIMSMSFPDNSIVNGVYLGNVEKEFLLPPGMSYEIKNKKTEIVNGISKTIIEVEFLPNKHVHVLGGDQDMQGFKDFVGKKEQINAVPTVAAIPSPLQNSQASALG